MLIDRDGWASCDAVAIERVPSPNCDARPDASDPSLIVVHGISLPPGQFGGRAIDALFTNTLDVASHPYFERLEGLRVSSHFLIRRDGAMVQFVSCAARAWHAGVSSFAGREHCNDFSIGIELEGTDDRSFESPQYVALVTLVGALTASYAIRAIAGHSEIAAGRKTDPGPCFDWSRLMKDLDPALRGPDMSMPDPHRCATRCG